MICRICNEDINEKGQDNVSPFSHYPVCEDCIDQIQCEDCFEYCTDHLIYIEEWDKLLCRDCLVEEAEKKGIIKSIKYFFDADYNEIATDADCEPVIDYIKEYLGI